MKPVLTQRTMPSAALPRASRRSSRALIALLGASTLLASAATGAVAAGPVPGTAGATTISGAAEAARPAFYEPPAVIPATPGTIIRSEDAAYVLDPLGLSAGIARATKVMYASKDRTGTPIAVTGIVIVPKAAYWAGNAARPLISYAPGTQGMADRCAPSRQMADGVQYEILGFGGLVTSGYAVAMTDYQGLGTPGSHTYMNRLAQGQAVLDMARAAQRLPGSGLGASTPLGIMGYSQGGGAAAAAAEIYPSYAPELKLKGVSAGAVPADLAAVGVNLDGGTFAAFLGYATVGLAAGYGVDVNANLNPAGQQYAKDIEGACVTDLFAFAGKKSSLYTANGQSLTSYYTQAPWAGILAENKIGNVRPTVPVLVSHSTMDDTIPFAVGKAMAKSWCGKGANVYFSPNLSVGHLGGMANHIAESQLFFSARFSGLPQWSNCWAV